MLHRNILVAHLFCALLRFVERGIQILRNIDLVGTRAGVIGRQLVDLALRVLSQKIAVRARCGEDAADQPIRLRKQRKQQMRLRHLRIVPLAGGLLCALHRFNAFLC